MLISNLSCNGETLIQLLNIRIEITNEVKIV